MFNHDSLREEFDKLEREVRQRDCRHERTVEMREMGERPRWLCLDCGAMLDRPPEGGA